MTKYRYGTVLRALDDDPKPGNDVAAGDIHVRAGMYEDGDKYEVLAGKSFSVVEFETVSVYKSDQLLSKEEMVDFVRDRAIEDPEVNTDDA